MMEKLEIGKQYLYLITVIGNPSYIQIPKQFTGIYSGIDENNNVVFKDVKFTHVPYKKKFEQTDKDPAKIPVTRFEGDKDFLPLDPITNEPFEINSIEDVESAILKLVSVPFEKMLSADNPIEVNSNGDRIDTIKKFKLLTKLK